MRVRVRFTKVRVGVVSYGGGFRWWVTGWAIARVRV